MTQTFLQKYQHVIKKAEIYTDFKFVDAALKTAPTKRYEQKTLKKGVKRK
jgi:hypothetical protein